MDVRLESLCWRHTLKKLVLVRNASRLVQETCTCVGQSCAEFFLIQVFLHAVEHSSIVYSSTEAVRHVTRTMQRDWPESCC